jgi:hypothetical protein
MIVAEVTRNLNYIYLTNYAPFVYVGTTKYRSFKTSWGTSCDDLFDTGARVKVLQVTRDYLNKYLQEYTLAECLAQEGSFYFDRENQLVYVHIEHGWSPQTSVVDYGYAFGVCSQKLGYIYIDDYQYEPVITDATDISLSADDVTVDQPKGSTSSLQMNNTSRYNELTGLPEGVLDFIFTESLAHNDVFIYNYRKGILSRAGAFFVENFDISETEITLNLQDKRFS